jgi:hypothetical protein
LREKRKQKNIFAKTVREEAEKYETTDISNYDSAFSEQY